MAFFEDYGIYKSAIHSFESGKSMMSFERLDVALQAMNVDLEEYEHLINNFHPEYLEEILTKIITASIHGDIEQLKEIERSAYSNEMFLISVAAKSVYAIPEKEEIEDVVDYLYQIKSWGYFEISIFYLTLDHFTERDIIHLMEDFWDRGKDAYGIFKYRRRFMEASFKAVVLLSSRGNKVYAEMIMNKSYFQRDAKDIYVQILRKLALGFYEQCFGDREKGLRENERFFSLFEELGYPELANYYRKRQNKLRPSK